MRRTSTALAAFAAVLLLAGCGDEAPKNPAPAPAAPAEAKPAPAPVAPAAPAQPPAAVAPAPAPQAVTVKAEGEGMVLGQVLNVDGEAGLLRDLKKLPLAGQMELRHRDRITTGKDGSVELRLGPGNTVLVQPSSTVVLLREGKASGLELPEAAKVRCQLDGLQAGEEFSVKTPVAVAGVRGTDFVTAYDPSDAQGSPFSLSVLSGTVNLQNLLAKGGALREMVVGQGQQQLLDKAGSFLPAKLLDKAGLDALMKGNAIGDLRKQFLAEKLQGLKDKAQEKLQGVPGAQDQLRKFLK